MIKIPLFILSTTFALLCAACSTDSTTPAPPPVAPPQTAAEAPPVPTQSTTISTTLPVRDAENTANAVLSDMGFSRNGGEELDYFSANTNYSDVDGQTMTITCKWVQEGQTTLQFNSTLEKVKHDFVLAKLKTVLAAAEQQQHIRSGN